MLRFAPASCRVLHRVSFVSIEMMNWSDINRNGAGDAPVLAPVVVNVPSKANLLSDIEQRLKEGRGFCIATLNLDHVVKFRRLPAFRDAYTRHSHITADGNPIVWLSRLAGHDIHLAPGSELIEPIAAIAARLDVPVALFGSTQTSLEKAALALTAQYPGLRVVAKIAPPIGFIPDGPEADACIDEIKASGARICFLALGAPKQEIFAVRAYERLPDMGFLSIGAGLDFISGSQVRAPKFMRAIGAEWLWRLASNPRRLAGRYWACATIFPNLTWAALRARITPRNET